MPKDNETNGGTSSSQPPPPDYQGSDGQTPWSPGKGKTKKDEEMNALEAIYFHLLEMRRVVDKLVEESKEEKIHRRLEVVPVRISDLMRGFQAAVARANRSTSAGEGEEEDIERMSVKDLEISLSAPIIEGGHAADPVVMLPNIKSVDAESAKISLKFSIVSVPMKKRS
jgi:hypothetical protein